MLKFTLFYEFDWFYWVTASIGDRTVATIVKNINVDDKYVLHIYDMSIPNGDRMHVLSVTYHDRECDAKEHLLKQPLSILQVG
jgi:hypothetical protein